MESRKPSAIIVGGGPVGLTAALGLTRAGIDFTVLEQRKTIVVEDGSDMTLLPMTMRALDQMGLLKPLSGIWSPVSRIERIDHRGRALGELRIFEYIQRSTGYYPNAVSRRGILQAMYDALSEEQHEKVIPGKQVSKIQSMADGVVVSCTDGTTYEGTFVIGADGAYSATRECMRELALEAGSADVNDAEPFLTTYQALWVRFPTAKFSTCTPGTAVETHGPGIATQMFPGDVSSTVGVYKTLPAPTRKSSRYDETDQAALIKEWGHLPLLKKSTMCLRDAYNTRLGSGLVSLEEGVLAHWSWAGRVVLVGDAAHKFTPSRGTGLNHGILDVVVLVNQLCDLSARHRDDARPWWHQSSLAEAFQAYQQKRLEDVTTGCQESSGATALATWTNVGLKLVDQYVFPNPLIQWLIGRSIASNEQTAKPLGFEFDSCAARIL